MLRLLPLVALTMFAPLAGVRGGEAEGTPPDLRLEWLDGSRSTGSSAAPLRGEEGATVTVAYRLRNVGGSNAFAVLLDAWTALGRTSRARLQPGPAAGASVDRALRLALATGMRELCLEARLQTVEPDHPGDANRSDNRICRKVEVEGRSEDRRPGAARDMGEPR